ncbi:hypothetical protein BD626DRAFT_611095 [Schizophyllum amplum]|uniref:Transferase family-domain-containing protein n=1 Tax=Schizophyllum amplum TaxID=97359 RepID=A0A550C1Z9_9AGAR|nr:hypothetical protein BD626DRAFT_611095 [Auriculariopsis ampla]
MAPGASDVPLSTSIGPSASVSPSASFSSSLRVPLSPLDINGPDISGITTGYVLQPGLDEDALRAALARVVDKWRLLAGRVVWDDAAQNYYIDVPLGPLPGESANPPPYKFTVSRRAEALAQSTPVAHVGDASVAILHCPPIAHFRDPGTVHALSDVAVYVPADGAADEPVNSAAHAPAPARAWQPLVSVHITHFTDYSCVGVSVAHGLFDAVGLGQVLAAIDAELNGRVWAVPPMYGIGATKGEPELPTYGSGNPVAEALRALEEDPAMLEEEPVSLMYLKRVLVPKEPDGLQQFMQRVEYEWTTQAVEHRAVYLGKKVVKDLVARVNAELARESGGKEHASSGDVLLAWFLKAAHGDEVSQNELLVVPYTSMRGVLSTVSGTDLSNYTHNCKYLFALPPLTIDALRAAPLSLVAVMSRRALLAARQPPAVQALLQWRERTGTLLNRQQGTDSWLVSNQCIGRFSKIDFGVEMVSFWSWTPSRLQMDHIITVNEFKGGYVVQAPMRRSRWSAMERALDAMRKL